jgi:phage recombination protein Bet
MTNKKTDALAPQTQAAIMIPPELELNWEDIRKHYAPKATDKEFALFCDACKANSLDPRKREAYFIKYGEKPGQIVTGYQTYLKRAERSGKLDGWDVNLVMEGGKAIQAVITIYRKDRERPVVWTVEAEEFNKGQSTWNQMPCFMLKKVAIAQGFRLAFPDELSGIPYTPDELSTFADEDTARAALDITDSVEQTPAPKRKVKPKPDTKKNKDKPPAETPEPEKDKVSGEATEKPEATQTPEATPDPVQTPSDGSETAQEPIPDAKKTVILDVFKEHGISKELIEGVTGAKYEEWHEGHRLWLLDRYHECEAGAMNAKKFAGLEYE